MNNTHEETVQIMNTFLSCSTRNEPTELSIKKLESLMALAYLQGFNVPAPTRTLSGVRVEFVRKTFPIEKIRPPLSREEFGCSINADERILLDWLGRKPYPESERLNRSHAVMNKEPHLQAIKFFEEYGSVPNDILIYILQCEESWLCAEEGQELARKDGH